MDPQTLQQNIVAARARGVPEAVIQARVQQIQQGVDVATPTPQASIAPVANIAPTTNPVAQQAQQSGIDPAVAYNQLLKSKLAGGQQSQTSPQASAPAKPSVIASILGGAGNILHNIMSNPIFGALPNAVAKFAPKDALDILPIAGGAAGGIGGAAIPVAGETGLGEVAGATAGQTAGKALENYLQGKKVSTNLPEEAGAAAIGGGLGLGAGKILGGVLGKAGEDFATKGLGLTTLMKNKIAQANGGETVAQTLLKHNIAGADAESLQSGIQKLQSAFDNIASNKPGDVIVPTDPNILLKNTMAAVDQLNQSDVPGKADLAKKVDQTVTSILDKFKNGTYDSLGDLNKVRKQFDTATPQSQFGSDNWNLTRTVGNILRKSVQENADKAGLIGPNGQSLQQLGQDLSHLYNINDIAKNRQGMDTGGSLFSVTNLLFGGEAGAGAAMLGVNPLLAGALAVGARKATAIPAIAAGISKGASGLGNGISSLANPLGVAGVLGGGAAVNALTAGSGGTPPQNPDENNQQNNIQNTSPSTTTINGNTDAVNGQPGIVQQDVNGIKIPVEKDTGHLVLPDLNKSITQIPGLPFDEQKINDAIAKYGNNPYLRPKIDAAIAQNDRAKSQYLSTHQLDGSEVDFMRNAGVINDQVNQLSDMLKTQGNKNIFQSIASDNPLVRAAKVKLDPTGQYATMLSLMTSLQGQAAKSAVGGRLSNFDIQFFSNMPTPGDTLSAANAKIKQAQAKLYDQYQRLYPAYGLTLNAAQQQASQDQISQQQNPNQGFNALQQTLYQPQGGGQ